MEHVEQTVVLQNGDAVALGVALRLDEPQAVGNLHGVGEVVIGLAKLGADDVVSLQFHRIGVLGSDINLGIGEFADAVAVVGVLVGDENLGHLLGFVARSGEGLHIVGNLLSHIERGT